MCAMAAAAVGLRPAAADDCDTIGAGATIRPLALNRSTPPGFPCLPTASGTPPRSPIPIAGFLSVNWTERTSASSGSIASDDSALVSIFLAPERIGGGLGTALLEAGCAAISDEWSGLSAIEADVLAANPASQAIFTRAGFRPQRTRLRLDLSRVAGSLREAP